LWQDGTTNQLIFGEKHIPTWALGQGVSATPSWDGMSSWDNSYLFTWPGEFAFGCTRLVVTMPNNAPWPVIARSAAEPAIPVNTNAATMGWGQYGFGSNHPGTVNFALGDGSIRGVSVTVLPSLIVDLSDVNDGNSVSLP
jgi:hypothetical protein